MIWGAFTNSTQAMMAQSQSLGTISQNIANVNTGGYKRTETLFQTVLSETTAQADFFGVQGRNRTLVDRQGVVLPTGNWNDLAINGKGMFVMQSDFGGGEALYSRDGSFFQRAISVGTESNNYLVNSQGHFLQGWQADAAGNIANSGATTAVYTSPNSVIAAAQTSSLIVRGTIPAGVANTSFTLPVYDTNGATQTISVDWTAAGANSWSVGISAVNGTVVAPAAATTVTFDGHGQMVTPGLGSSLPVSISWASGETNALSLDFTRMSQYGGSNQVIIDSVDGNGYPDGVLMSTQFDGNGVLSGTYSNGETRRLFQLAVADFAAPNELEMRSGNIFAESALSGEAVIGSINSVTGSTAFIPGSIETSNVQLEDEFTKMIMTQKAYSSSATVFRTSDEMTEVARDLM